MININWKNEKKEKTQKQPVHTFYYESVWTTGHLIINDIVSIIIHIWSEYGFEPINFRKRLLLQILAGALTTVLRWHVLGDNAGI